MVRVFLEARDLPGLVVDRRGVEGSVVVRVFGTGQELSGLSVHGDHNLGPTIPIRVQSLGDARPVALAAHLGVEDAVRDLPCRSRPGSAQRIRVPLGGGQRLLFIAQHLVELLLAGDGLEELLLTPQLLLDLRLERALAFELILDLGLERIVHAAATASARSAAPATLERHLPGDETVQAEHGCADRGAGGSSELAADDGADDHPLDAALRVLLGFGRPTLRLLRAGVLGIVRSRSAHSGSARSDVTSDLASVTGDVPSGALSTRICGVGSGSCAGEAKR